MFKEFTSELKTIAKLTPSKNDTLSPLGSIALYLDNEQFDVPVGAINGLLSMVGIVKWKTRLWEDDYNQISGNFEMVLANEDGPI